MGQCKLRKVKELFQPSPAIDEVIASSCWLNLSRQVNVRHNADIQINEINQGAAK